MGNLDQLSQMGVSIWLDDLSRGRLTSGNLEQLIAEKSVVGVTTNPAIFQASISGSDDYQEAINALGDTAKTPDDVVTSLTTQDVREACDLLRSVYEQTKGYDGRVSIEVDPRLAHQGDKTKTEAKKLYELVDRENVMIKIPATKQGLSAITATIAEGISVNVTLIFSVERYREVMDAYLKGLELAQEAGKDLSTIHSVASLFVSRVDTEVDKRLEKLGGPDALALRGKAGIANARLAYGTFREVFSSERFAALESNGAHLQRPLWASTGVKNPNYSPTMYVDQLVAQHVVNTMPEGTLNATAESAKLTGDTITAHIEDAKHLLEKIVYLGVDFTDVTDQLEEEGVEKFEIAWSELLETVQDAMG